VTTTLVTTSEYRALTCDEATTNDQVSALVDAAISIIGDECDRWLPLSTYTETLLIRPGWLIYPHGVPIVTAPSGTQLRMNNYAVWGAPSDVMNDPSFVFPQDLPNYGMDNYDSTTWWEWRATVQYTGGFDHDTLPPKLRYLICLLARGLKSTPAGRTSGAAPLLSATVGDVTVQYSSKSQSIVPSLLDMAVPGMSRMLFPYRRPTGRI
jgi:hypothetical protein